ncbi:TPA: HoxN/HupN/NixA family nickel/cobalt transporter [Escherichia coli]|nr:HoxN/HupN/NixA family nickel/cobalt transporter [Escherichia coli]HBA9522902.1 HoxN/HupN/NixA family nickel/cobalt transporter [Escherichia coli]HBA9550836.1 HoxN/HupN/NixA family nickel/cobalt transporter [Escherichia coli]HBA9560308.1 HoxN/HupN/NixA family nickel/cobalt transporter [Escherichia coli]
MINILKERTIHNSQITKRRAIFLLIGLLAINGLAWIWAFIEFRDNSVLMGMALLAYSLGLRHAVDADHIAAIDNVTRKLMQHRKIPIAVGTFFSLGHSTIVILASLTIAATAMVFKNDIAWLHETGGVIGTLVSSAFLLLFAFLNLTILISVYKRFKQIKFGYKYKDDDLDFLAANHGGLLAKAFSRVFNLVDKSWHMYLVGFLFGLGFDTATEIGVLGIAATNATHGMSLWAIMVFPILFTGGMALIDSLDNFVMIGAYGWAFSNPVRKLYYNMTVTAASVIVAFFIGGIESLGLIAEKMNLNSGIWTVINRLGDNLGELGYWVIGLFILCWIFSAAIYHVRGYDSLRIDR